MPGRHTHFFKSFSKKLLTKSDLYCNILNIAEQSSVKNGIDELSLDYLLIFVYYYTSELSSVHRYFFCISKDIHYKF